MRRAGAVPLILTLCLLALPAVAGARTAGRWAQVSPSAGQHGVTQPWLLRVAGGTLLVAYDDPTGAGSILTSTISPAGDIGQGPKIADGYASVSDPAVIAGASGLTAFFGGIHTTDTTDPNQNLNYGTAPSAAGPWTVPPGSVASANSADDNAYGSPVSAAALADGTPLQAWASTLGLFVHRGFDQTVPEQNFQGQLGACCAYDAQLALDGSTGAPAVAWYSNAPGKHGVWYQAFDPATTAATGTPVNVPETSVGDQGLDLRGRIPFTSCAGQAGLWVAAQVGAPSQSKVVLWKAGASGATTLDDGDGQVRNVALSCGPDGRLWVAWIRSNPLQLSVVRSNPERTEFGAPAVIDLPDGSTDSFRLAASAQANLLDVVGTLGDSSNAAVQGIQVQPALEIAVRSTFSVRRGGTATVKATVTDAGDPVRGVVLRLAGHSAKTNKKGVATVKLRRQRRTRKYKLTASLRGYTRAVARPRVKIKKP